VLEVERYFTGDLSTEPFELTFRGPVSRRYFNEVEPSGFMSDFSPCGAERPLNIRTSVRVSNLMNPSGSGNIRISPPWGIQSLRLHWRRCS
jgi:hypothetical protein